MYGIDPIGDRHVWTGYGLMIHLDFCWLQQSQGGKYRQIIWTIANEYWVKIGAMPPGTLQNISAFPKWNSLFQDSFRHFTCLLVPVCSKKITSISETLNKGISLLKNDEV